MSTWDVLAVAVDPRDGTPLAEPRIERIEADNEIFAGCTGPWDVEDRYNIFWNRLNDWWEHEVRPEKVLVIRVTEVEG